MNDAEARLDPARPPEAAWRTLAKVVGGAVLIASLVALTRQIQTALAASSSTLELHGGQLAVVAMVSAVAFGCAQMAYALGWATLVRAAGGTLTNAAALRLNGRTQIAKYLPSNVLHLASRHVLGRATGLGHATLAAAALWEVVAVVVAALAVAALALSLAARPGEAALIAVVAMVAVLVTVVTSSVAGPRFGLAAPVGLGRHLGRAVLLAAVPQLVAATIFAALLAMVGATTGFSAVAAFLLAWIAGYVTPTAPAGLGVREAVLLYLLADLDPRGALVAAAVHRAITVVGDLVYFLCPSLVLRVWPEPVSGPQGGEATMAAHDERR